MPEIRAPEIFRKTLTLPRRVTEPDIAEIEATLGEDEVGHPEKSERIFMVICEGGGLPTRVHPTRGHAKMEAMRLALKNPTSRFHVLQTWRVFAADLG